MLERVAIYSKENNSKTRMGSTGLCLNFAEGDQNPDIPESEENSICPDGELIERFNDLSTISRLPDMVLSVGGDGTFLETVLKSRTLDSYCRG